MILVLLFLKTINESLLSDLTYLKKRLVVEILSMLGRNTLFVEVRVFEKFVWVSEVKFDVSGLLFVSFVWTFVR